MWALTEIILLPLIPSTSNHSGFVVRKKLGIFIIME
jgi:hypothetical protein